MKDTVLTIDCKQHSEADNISIIQRIPIKIGNNLIAY